jgi:hypothetical protein
LAACAGMVVSASSNVARAAKVARVCAIWIMVGCAVRQRVVIGHSRVGAFFQVIELKMSFYYF